VIDPFLYDNALSVAGTSAVIYVGIGQLGCSPPGGCTSLGHVSYALAQGPPASWRWVDVVDDAALPAHIAIHQNSVYWTDNGKGTVNHATLVATDATVLAEGESEPGDLAVTDEALYWSTGGGQVRRRDPQGTITTLIDMAPLAIYGLALDAKHIYFVATTHAQSNDPEIGRVHRIPRGCAPCTAATLFSTNERLADVVVDATHVYFATYTSGKIYARDKAAYDLASP
jgi:hypothetical protein